MLHLIQCLFIFFGQGCVYFPCCLHVPSIAQLVEWRTVGETAEILRLLVQLRLEGGGFCDSNALTMTLKHKTTELISQSVMPLRADGTADAIAPLNRCFTANIRQHICFNPASRKQESLSVYSD